jgi:signal transduction histidine kinase
MRLREVPPVLQDLVIVAVLSTLQLALLAPTGPHPAIAVVVAAEPLPLLLRRTHPTIAIALLAAIDVALMQAGASATAIGPSLVVAAYSAGAHQPRRRAVGSLVLALLGLLAAGALPPASQALADVVGVVVVTTVAWWIGSSLRERRYYAAELEQRTQALAVARLELAERAVAAERLRLARELHDVVAHSLAIIALHSSVGAHNAAAHPDDAVAALNAINTATRSALGELRAMLAVLRDSDGEAASDTAPLPSLADLPALVDQAVGAGVAVRVSVDGDVDAIPRAVSLSAYRVVQEALTNVVKHAGPVDASVMIGAVPGRVAIAVTNGPPRGVPGPSPPEDRPVRPGAGLAGMRERVAAFAGTLDAHPTAEGGWAVHATLMFEETE